MPADHDKKKEQLVFRFWWSAARSTKGSTVFERYGLMKTSGGVVKFNDGFEFLFFFFEVRGFVFRVKKPKKVFKAQFEWLRVVEIKNFLKEDIPLIFVGWAVEKEVVRVFKRVAARPNFPWIEKGQTEFSGLETVNNSFRFSRKEVVIFPGGIPEFWLNIIVQKSPGGWGSPEIVSLFESSGFNALRMGASGWKTHGSSREAELASSAANFACLSAVSLGIMSTVAGCPAK